MSSCQFEVIYSEQKKIQNTKFLTCLSTFKISENSLNEQNSMQSKNMISNEILHNLE